MELHDIPMAGLAFARRSKWCKVPKINVLWCKVPKVFKVRAIPDLMLHPTLNITTRENPKNDPSVLLVSELDDLSKSITCKISVPQA